MSTSPFAQGGCVCGKVRFALTTRPIVVHCCHCSWCQRESGSAFALNAVIEANRVELLGDPPERIDTPSASGRGQAIFRCPNCKIAVWSNYSGMGALTKFVRVGTLDDPAACPPDAHIFTGRKQPWVVISKDAETFTDYYSGKDVARIYSEDGFARWKALKG